MNAGLDAEPVQLNTAPVRCWAQIWENFDTSSWQPQAEMVRDREELRLRWKELDGSSLGGGAPRL